MSSSGSWRPRCGISRCCPPPPSAPAAVAEAATGVIAGVAVVVTAAGITATSAFDRPPQGAAAPGPVAVGPAASCILTLPSDPAGVRVRVLDGGRGDTTANELRERGFTVVTHTSGSANEPSGATTLRYGPAAIGGASLLRAALIGDVTMRFEPARFDDTIDLMPGTTFERFATSTEFNQALVAVGEPSAPPEC